MLRGRNDKTIPRTLYVRVSGIIDSQHKRGARDTSINGTLDTDGSAPILPPENPDARARSCRRNQLRYSRIFQTRVVFSSSHTARVRRRQRKAYSDQNESRRVDSFAIYVEQPAKRYSR